MKVDVVEVDDGGERVEVEVRVQTMDGEGLRSKYPGFYFFWAQPQVSWCEA